MRFKKYAEYSRGLHPIALVPLVNIIFLALILGGVCFGYLSVPSGLGVRLPRAVTSRAVQGTIVQVEVLADGTLRLRGQELTAEELLRFLDQTSGRKQTVVINADSRATWEHVVRAWEAVRAGGRGDCIMATHP